MDRIWKLLLISLPIAFPLLLVLAIWKIFFSKRAGINSEPLQVDKAALAAAEKVLKEEAALDWVVLKRCHGPAYNHSALTELVSALHAGGVQATYDVISTSSADGGVTNYMLKVLRGDEKRALEILAETEQA